jgi:hypothetical protein
MEKVKITFFSTGFNGSAKFGVYVDGVSVEISEGTHYGTPEDLYYFLKEKYPEAIGPIVDFYGIGKKNQSSFARSGYPEAVRPLDSSHRVEIGRVFCECDK